ncbi:6093_t:CDS:10 [Ambispora leptoticha]|uniref:6093_t:CDS:1 n=1 Tax=Ambispora leptoticha TaxID=144679 RepID=A0A9N8VEH0_9GLOM|nr:6093_t:CDS:10 [Ambispora leptoticha]
MLRRSTRIQALYDRKKSENYSLSSNSEHEIFTGATNENNIEKEHMNANLDSTNSSTAQMPNETEIVENDSQVLPLENINENSTCPSPSYFLKFFEDLSPPLSPTLPEIPPRTKNDSQTEDKEEIEGLTLDDMDLNDDNANLNLDNDISDKSLRPGLPPPINWSFFTKEIYQKYTVATLDLLMKENVKALIARKKKLDAQEKHPNKETLPSPPVTAQLDTFKDKNAPELSSSSSPQPDNLERQKQSKSSPAEDIIVPKSPLSSATIQLDTLEDLESSSPRAVEPDNLEALNKLELTSAPAMDTSLESQSKSTSSPIAVQVETLEAQIVEASQIIASPNEIEDSLAVSAQDSNSTNVTIEAQQSARYNFNYYDDEGDLIMDDQSGDEITPEQETIINASNFKETGSESGQLNNLHLPLQSFSEKETINMSDVMEAGSEVLSAQGTIINPKDIDSNSEHKDRLLSSTQSLPEKEMSDGNQTGSKGDNIDLNSRVDLIGPLLKLLDERKELRLQTDQQNKRDNNSSSSNFPLDILTASSALSTSQDELALSSSQTSSDLIQYSSLTKEDHKEFLQISLLFNQSPHLLDENQFQRYKYLGELFHKENQRYLQWTYDRSIERLKFLNNDIKNQIENQIYTVRLRVQKQYPRYYRVFSSIGISFNAPMPGDPVLTYKELIYRIGTCYGFCIPEMKLPISINLDRFYWSDSSAGNHERPPLNREWQKLSMPVVSSDPLIPKMVSERDADIVISSSGLCAIIALNATTDLEFEIPVIVRERKLGGTLRKTVYIDKPLAKHRHSPREYNQKFYDVAFKSVVSKFPIKVEDIVKVAAGNSRDMQKVESNSNNICNEEKPGDSKVSKITEPVKVIESDSEVNKAIGQAKGEDKEVKENNIDNTNETSELMEENTTSKNITDSQTGNMLNDAQLNSGNLMYTLWSFGDLTLLIRCKAHGFIYQGERQTRKPQIVSMKSKMEYQADIGLEEITNAERARWWIHSYIRGNSHLMLGYFGYRPMAYSKLLQNILKQLHTSLPKGTFILSHKKKDLHLTVYESVSEDFNQSNAKPKLYDLHTAHSQLPQMDLETVPFVKLQWTGPTEQVAYTFPPVTSFCFTYANKGLCSNQKCRFPHVRIASGVSNGSKNKKNKMSQDEKRKGPKKDKQKKTSPKKKKQKISKDDTNNDIVRRDFDSEIVSSSIGDGSSRSEFNSILDNYRQSRG